MEYKFRWESPLGGVWLAGAGEALTGLWFEGQKYFPVDLDAKQTADLPIFWEAICWLESYFAGQNPGKLPEIRLRGTPFRRAVWEILLTIPYGQTITYGQIAAALEKRMSAQAVGGAVGHNPISIIVPCHRVLGANGSLTGYAGGMERKEYLLRLEGGRIADS